MAVEHPHSVEQNGDGVSMAVEHPHSVEQNGDGVSMADNVSLKQFVEMAILDRSKVISVATTTEAVVCWIANSQQLFMLYH